MLGPILTVLTLFAAAAPLDALQKEDAERKSDPYTHGAPEALQRAGYVSLGPFPLGHDQNGQPFTSEDVEKALGNIEIRWIETAHFRIGCTLPSYAAEDKRERDKLRAELAELQQAFPEVDPARRRPDPWLRAHLYARRLENLYADFQRRLGATDADFPVKPGTLVNGEYRGEGPYLGQPTKYVVLLMDKASAVGRFFGRFCGQQEDRPRRYNFMKSGMILFATSIEHAEGTLVKDSALHCNVVFNVTHNLVDGYKYYTVDAPVWWKEGLAHWFARRVDERWNNFSAVAEEAGETRATWNWPPKVRGRVKNEYFPPAEELMAWNSYDERRFSDHMMMWSRVDYLMSTGDAGFATFMKMIKGAYPGVSGIPDHAAVVARQAEALQQAWGLDYAAFDREWAAYVLKNYPEK